MNSPAAYPQFGTYPIQMANAHQDAKPFLQGSLHSMTWCVRSLAARSLKPLAHNFTKFRRVSMPSILQRCFPSRADVLQEPVGC